MNETHLPTLNSIASESYRVIEKLNGVSYDKLFGYADYIPIYSKFVIRFGHIEQLKGKQIAIEEIISNLTMYAKYY